MLFQPANDIIKTAVISVSDLNSYNFAQLILEALRTALFHLRLTESQLILLTLHVMIIEIVPNRMCETMLQALLPEVFRHLIKITLTSAI